MAFVTSGFAQFMSSGAGRAGRVVTGLALIGWGYLHRDAGSGLAFMLVGLLPLAAGLLDICVLGPLFGGPLSGSAIRAAAPRRH